LSAEELARLEFKHSFRRSSRGNLWRKEDDLTVSVFSRTEGGYKFCIAAGEEWRPSYSKNIYETEDEALEALFTELCGF
jgi:hypothetical protein